jgi:signal transduction histidine kinase
MEKSGGRLEIQLKDVELTNEYGFAGQQAVSGSFLKLIIADTGSGIRQEHVNRIFEPFFTTRKKKGGTGMGLAIVHGIVQGYGGKISVKSLPGAGTTFEILWPIAEPESAPEVQ